MVATLRAALAKVPDAQSLFAIETGHGAVRLTAAEAGLSIQARPFTPGGGGTYGQSVPAGVGQPTTLVSALTVGGTAG